MASRFGQVVDSVVLRPAVPGSAEFEAEYLLDPAQRVAENQGDRFLQPLIRGAVPDNDCQADHYQQDGPAASAFARVFFILNLTSSTSRARAF